MVTSIDAQVPKVTMSDLHPIDALVDLNTIDETGLPWAFLDHAPRPDRVVPGTYVVAGSGQARGLALVLDVTDGIVHVQPLRGSVASHAALLARQPLASYDEATHGWRSTPMRPLRVGDRMVGVGWRRWLAIGFVAIITAVVWVGVPIMLATGLALDHPAWARAGAGGGTLVSDTTSWWPPGRHYE